jgi:hypothetical protein
VTPSGDVLKSGLDNRFDANDTLVVKVIADVRLLSLLQVRRVTAGDNLVQEIIGSDETVPTITRQAGLVADCGVRQFTLLAFVPGLNTLQISARQGTRFLPLSTFDIQVERPWWDLSGWSISSSLLSLLGILSALLLAVRLQLRSKKEKKEQKEQQERFERLEREKQEAVQALERQRLQIELDRPGVSTPQTTNDAEAEAPFTPDVPDDLIAACVSETCVLFTGAGLPVQAGYPTTSEILGNLLQRAEKRGNLELQREILTALRGGRYAEVSELLALRLPKDLIAGWGSGELSCRPAATVPSVRSAPPDPVHRSGLQLLGCAGRESFPAEGACHYLSDACGSRHR